MKKKIIFGAPLTDGPATDIIKNLEYCRFEVIDITINQNFKYKKFGDRVINFGKKVFLNDNSYKKKLRFDLYRSHITKNLEALENADFGLIIRPDIYPINFLKKIKKKCSHLVGYQWDGMNRFKEIKNYVSVFDEFFVFDPDDSDEKHSPVTNFYFDFDIENNQNVKENNQIYFLGTYLKPRLKDLEELIGPIKKNNLIPKIIIYNPKKRKINNPDIISIDSPISFEKNILFTRESKILIDIPNQAHNGLSFRIFEAIKYQKKIITNNLQITDYDLYNENNIFVWNGKNQSLLDDFLKKPLIPYSDLILKKYSFTNWIHYILGIEPNIKISLPKKAN